MFPITLRASVQVDRATQLVVARCEIPSGLGTVSGPLALSALTEERAVETLVQTLRELKVPYLVQLQVEKLDGTVRWYPITTTTAAEEPEDPIGITIGKALASQWLNPADEYKTDLVKRFEHALETYQNHTLLKSGRVTAQLATEDPRRVIERILDDVIFTMTSDMGPVQCAELRDALTRRGWTWDRTNQRTKKYGADGWLQEYWYNNFYRHLVLRSRGGG